MKLARNRKGKKEKRKIFILVEGETESLLKINANWGLK
ncbi:hypothetical protein FM130_02035 [Enterococcus faecium]|nr:hypothetical protein FM130_02035 [Enterococcus faecium]